MENLKSLSNVILLTRGTKGDLYPFINMGRGFKQRGYNVTLLSNYCYESYAIQESLEFIPLDDEESYQIFNNMPEYYKNLPSLLELYREHTVSTVEKELQIIESIVTKGNATIVANSNHYLAALFAKEKYNIALHLCVLAPSYLHGFALFEAFLKRLSNELNKVRSEMGLAAVYDWGLWLKKFNHCFAFWPSWFSDGANKNILDMKYLGFLAIDNIENVPLQEEIENFIDTNQKKILITHGTSKPFSDNFFKLGIEVCEMLGFKLIVSTPFRELLPKSLPAHVVWVEFCPFHKLLPMIDLIIHHGGIGTAREAIANSTPQIIIGQGFDRQHNARIIKALGLGDWIAPKSLNFGVLAQAVEKYLDKKELKLKCKEFMLSLYDFNAIDKFYDDVINHDSMVDGNVIDLDSDAYKYNAAETPEFSELKCGSISSENNNPNVTSFEQMSSVKQKLLFKFLKSKNIELMDSKKV